MALDNIMNQLVMSFSSLLREIVRIYVEVTHFNPSSQQSRSHGSKTTSNVGHVVNIRAKLGDNTSDLSRKIKRESHAIFI